MRFAARCAIVGLLLLVSVAHGHEESVSEASSSTEDTRPIHDERFNGHLAHYITMSKITFSNLRLAKNALADIRSGTRTFLQIAKDVSIENAQSGRQAPELQNGDLGLITYDLIEEELAEVAFDIRYPITKSADDILGPVCSPSGCSLLAVFSRFRKGFFSDAWWEAEQYCRERDFKFSELLQRLNSDDMSLVSSVIWPQEHILFRKMKIRQLREDIKKLNLIDPSTVLHVPSLAGKKGMTSHNTLMKRRERVFAQMNPKIIEEHSEVYAMSLEQMIVRGYLTNETLQEIDNAITAEESESNADLKEKYTKLDGSKKILMRKPASGCGCSDGASAVCTGDGEETATSGGALGSCEGEESVVLPTVTK